MDLLTIIIAGILQGILEWLPVSSQGNVMGLIIAISGGTASEALKISVFLHLGTMLSAIVYFRKEIIELIQLKDKELLKFLFIATIATLVTGLPSYLFLENFLNLSNTSIILVLIGTLLIFTGLLQAKNKTFGGGKLTIKNSIITGLAQGFSILPGISRSGITTTALIMRRIEPEKAFRISFLLSIPAVIAAQLFFSSKGEILIGLESIVGLLVAFIFGLVSIHLLLKIAKKINFSWFCLGLGALYLIGAVILII